MAEPKKYQYPGGKPIHREPYRRLPIERTPPSESRIPGLRQRSAVNAVGFHHLRKPYTEDEE